MTWHCGQCDWRGRGPMGIRAALRLMAGRAEVAVRRATAGDAEEATYNGREARRMGVDRDLRVRADIPSGLQPASASLMCLFAGRIAAVRKKIRSAGLSLASLACGMAPWPLWAQGTQPGTPPA